MAIEDLPVSGKPTVSRNPNLLARGPLRRLPMGFLISEGYAVRIPKADYKAEVRLILLVFRLLQKNRYTKPAVGMMPWALPRIGSGWPII